MGFFLSHLSSFTRMFIFIVTRKRKSNQTSRYSQTFLLFLFNLVISSSVVKLLISPARETREELEKRSISAVTRMFQRRFSHLINKWEKKKKLGLCLFFFCSLRSCVRPSAVFVYSKETPSTFSGNLLLNILHFPVSLIFFELALSQQYLVWQDLSYQEWPVSYLWHWMKVLSTAPKCVMFTWTHIYALFKSLHHLRL